MKRKYRYIAARICGSLVFLLLSIIFVLQIPSVQTSLARYAVGKVNGHIDGRIDLSAIKIIPPGTVVLKNLVIIDNHPKAYPDTFFSANTIAATLSWKWLFTRDGLPLAKVKVKDGGMMLVSEASQHRSNLARIFGIIPPNVPAEPGPGTVFSIGRVTVDNFRFRLKDRSHETIFKAPYGLDFTDLDVRTTVIGHDMHFTRGIMYATCDHCTIWADSCGYCISNVTGNCRVGQGMTLVQNIHLVDNWSDLYLDSYSMEYRKRHGIREFAKEVKLGATFGGGHLALATVDMFTHGFRGNPIDLDIGGGNVYGYLYDLGISNLTFHDRYSGLSGVVDGRMSGLPDIERFGVSARLENFRTDSDGVGRLISAFSPDSAPDLSSLAPGQVIRMNANFRGLMNKLRAEVSIDTPSGGMQAKARIYNLLDNSRPIEIDGSVTTSELDLRSLVSGLPVGDLTIGSDFYARLTPENPEISIDTLYVRKIDLLEGHYGDINARGGLKDGKIKLWLNSADPNLDLLIDASASTKKGGGLKGVKLTASFNDINLDTLGILDKVPLCGIRTRITADIKENDRGILLGDISIPNISMRSADGIVNSGAINLKARYGSSTQRINLTSNILDASYTGSGAISSFISDLKAITVGKYLPVLIPVQEAGASAVDGTHQCGTYALSVHFHKLSDVLESFIPGVQVADSSKARLEIRDAKLHGSLASSQLSVGGISARKVDLSFDNTENGISTYLLSDEVRLGKIKFRKAATSLSAKNDKVDVRLKYDNSNLNFECMLSRDRNDSLLISLQPYRSSFNFEGRRWDMKGLAMIRGNGVRVNDLSISSRNNSIKVQGDIGFGRRDTMIINASNFEMAFFDRLLGLDLNAEGTLDGYGKLSLPLENATDLDVNLNLKNASIAGAGLGDFSMKGQWDYRERAIVAELSNTNLGSESISAEARFSPETKEIDGSVKLDSLNLAIAGPFLENILSDLGGYVSGDFSINKSNDRIKITEKGACLQNAMAKVNYTGVTYKINGEMDIDSDGLKFDRLSISDMDQGKGELSGSIAFGKKSPGLNLGLNFKDLKLIDTPQKTWFPIYGNVSASGKAQLIGTSEGIKIKADVIADRQSDLHVPMNTALVSSTSDLLTFVSQIEYGKKNIQTKVETSGKSGKTKMEIDASLRISPDLTAWVEIDKTTGNKMTVRGDGLVSMKINSASGKVGLNGSYTIQDGDYHFVVPGLLEKDFDIKQGSSITLAGDLSETRLDIKAGHPVRASLSTLLSDSTAVGSRRAIDCIIGINGSLKSPKLAFDINIPDVDPSTKAQIESALNTEDKRQKQFMSLLVLGSFMPAEESGVVNGTNMLFSNVGEIMSGQINSIMQKLDIPVDFGFGYQQNLSGGNMYDVAISTQLFNNRVTVNGSVGSRQNGGSTSRSDVVGDIDVEVKIDKTGRWRATVFSHSANEYTSFLDNSQRNGVGISYQKEFNRLKELFMGKKKLEALNAEEKSRVKIKVE